MSSGYSFPVASHSYFRALNKEEQRIKFIAGQLKEPKFIYGDAFSEDVILSRLDRLEKKSDMHDSLLLVLAAARLQQSDDFLHEFRLRNEQRYGIPSYDFFQALMAYTRQCVDGDVGRALWEEIEEILRVRVPESVTHIHPKAELFTVLREYFNRYRKTETGPGDSSIESNINAHLQYSGLTKHGWKLALRDDSSHARINHHKKVIYVGRDYCVRTDKSAERIAVHEVYGHALRGTSAHQAEREGFAILLEQLIDEKFIFRRSYRYMAACLGWGLAGRAMSFREVYEVLWRVMVIRKSYNEESARKYAFDECYRVFRGGRPDLAGSVYLKDIMYFEANIAIWEQFSRRQPSYDDFVAIIEGKEVV